MELDLQFKTAGKSSASEMAANQIDIYPPFIYRFSMKPQWHQQLNS